MVSGYQQMRDPAALILHPGSMVWVMIVGFLNSESSSSETLIPWPIAQCGGEIRLVRPPIWGVLDTADDAPRQPRRTAFVASMGRVCTGAHGGRLGRDLPGVPNGPTARPVGCCTARAGGGGTAAGAGTGTLPTGSAPDLVAAAAASSTPGPTAPALSPGCHSIGPDRARPEWHGAEKSGGRGPPPDCADRATRRCAPGSRSPVWRTGAPRPVVVAPDTWPSAEDAGVRIRAAFASAALKHLQQNLGRGGDRHCTSMSTSVIHHRRNLPEKPTSRLFGQRSDAGAEYSVH